jgi:hypothetical protein
MEPGPANKDGELESGPFHGHNIVTGSRYANWHCYAAAGDKLGVHFQATDT